MFLGVKAVFSARGAYQPEPKVSFFFPPLSALSMTKEEKRQGLGLRINCPALSTIRDWAQVYFPCASYLKLVTEP